MNLDSVAMTDRMLAAIENPYAQIIATPLDGCCCAATLFRTTWRRFLTPAAKHGVAMECNSYPDRLDLRDVHLRMCKDRGVKVVISTDAHTISNLSFIQYGVTTARRGWLSKADVLNTPCARAVPPSATPEAGRCQDQERRSKQIEVGSG